MSSQSSNKHRTFVGLGLAAMLFALLAHADPPHLSNPVFADNKTGDSPQEVFSAETSEIFLSAQLIDVPRDTELRATWVAEQTDAPKPNYQVSVTDFTVQSDSTSVTFSLSKPGTGWALGTYRVDLFMNDQPLQQLHFKIVKTI